MKSRSAISNLILILIIVVVGVLDVVGDRRG